MFRFIEFAKLLVSLLPTLIQAIVVVENSFPGKGLGGDKLEMVKAILQGAYDIGEDGKITFDEVWPVMEKAINAIVKMFNKKGSFNQ